jgi:Flp pilus assembly protein TadG
MGRAMRAFIGDRKGNFAIMTAVLLPVILMAGGLGLNAAQIAMTRSNLLNALDSAVTSTARDLTLGTIEEKDARRSVEAFLVANGATGFASLERLALDAVTIDRLAGTVDARASVDIDLIFPFFSIGETSRVSAQSASIYSDKDIEVAMMLDITGSMDGQKIRDLKTAAKNAVDTFLAGNRDPSDPRVRVALVPYAEAVNVGSLSNVVYVEKNSKSPAEPPKLDDPRAVSGGRPDNCATERESENYQFSDASPYTSMVNRDYRLESCPTAVMRPLSANAKTLKATIDGFTAGGFTAGQIGIQWSWYMLSPKWRDVLPASAGPADFDAKKVAKYAILMTDGEFNTAYAGVKDDPRSDSEQNGQQPKSMNNAQTLCSRMKEQGIEIFSVGFKLTEKNAKAVMKDCASNDTGSVRHYYEVSTGDELNRVYQTIARNIERLTLTR